MTIKTIPLSQLVVSADNVRKTKTGIEGLAASIAAIGLLHNLQVHPNGGNFQVIAGGRRLAALQLLAKQKKIGGDFPVPCDVRETGDAIEVSLAENEMCEAMHPADQFEAFKKLADEGKGPEVIAAHFGVTPRVVEQRLKLAVVSPKLVAAYRKEEMTLDCLMAFTVSDDHKQQEKVWAGRPKWGNDPSYFRDALTEKHIEADNKLAQFVGIKAYEKAGGTMLRDLFDDEHDGWITDPALLNQLASAKLEKIAGEVRSEGWKWVEIVPDLTWETLKEFGKARPQKTSPTPEQQKEIDRLTRESDAIVDEYGEDCDDDDVQIRIGDIQGQIDQLSGSEFWPDEIKATAGVAIGVGYDGEPGIQRGLIRTDDKAAAKKAAKDAGGAADGKKDGDPETAGLPAKLIEDLTSHRTAGLQAKLADNPKVALVAVVHALALDCLYQTREASCLRVSGSVTYLNPSAESIKDSAAAKQLAATTKAATKGMPKQPEKLWAWLYGKDHKTLLEILAVCAASTVDAVQKRRGAAERAPDSAHAGQLADALKLDMAEYWEPTVDGYLGRVSKDLILAAVTNAIGKGAANNIASLKKAAMAKQAEQKLAGKGWLPAILR